MDRLLVQVGLLSLAILAVTLVKSWTGNRYQFVESNTIRGIIRRFCAAIDIDKGIDIPAFQETVGCDVVMGGIKTDISGKSP